MDFEAIKTEVESWLIDLPSGASTRVGGWVNKAIKDAEDRHNFRCMETATAATETVDQTRELLEKPSDWKEHRGDPYYVRQDGSNKPFNWAASESDMVQTYASTTPSEGNETPVDEGSPRYLLERETQIDVYPLPDEGSDWDDGNYRVVVPYWKYLADLSDNGDENFFTLRSPYYCIFKAAALGFAWNRDDARAADFELKAEREFKRIVRIDKLSKLPDRINLAVHKDVYAAQPRTGNKV